MNRVASWLSLFFLAIALTCSASAEEERAVIKIWPGGRFPGDDAAAIGPERELPFLPYRGGKYEVAGKVVRCLTAVTEPTLTVYKPAPEQHNGAAVIVCPGGGFWNLAIDLEGEEVAAWLNSQGITAILLKYRCPRRPGQEEKRPSPVALDDAQRAVSVARSHAQEWGFDPNRLGMIGFSVGGGIVAVTATNFDERRYQPVDEMDQISCRPDFGICCYSGYLRAKDKDELDASVKPNKKAPPLFLVHCTDDSEAKVDESVIGYLELKRAGVPVELHLYQKGEHGFAFRDLQLPVSRWPETLLDWMRFNGFLTPKSDKSTTKSAAR